MTKTITSYQAYTALYHVVQESPNGRDTVYEPPVPEYPGRCLYTYNGEPSCGVGKALAALGVPLNVLTILDTSSPSNNGPLAAGSDYFTWNLEREGFRLTAEAHDALSRFQRLQDRACTWGEALDHVVSSARYENEG
jgi:hypothetical protein